MQRTSLAKYCLIAGLVFVFGYFGIDKLVHPDNWIGWIPLWMEGFAGLPRLTWLMVIGISEITLALLLLVPARSVRMTGAVLIALHLVAILTQVEWNDVGVRDIGLLFGALSLIFLL